MLHETKAYGVTHFFKGLEIDAYTAEVGGLYFAGANIEGES